MTDKLEKDVRLLSENIDSLSNKIDTYIQNQSVYYDERLSAERERGNKKAWRAATVSFLLFFTIIIVYGTFF